MKSNSFKIGYTSLSLPLPFFIPSLTLFFGSLAASPQTIHLKHNLPQQVLIRLSLPQNFCCFSLFMVWRSSGNAHNGHLPKLERHLKVGPSTSLIMVNSPLLQTLCFPYAWDPPPDSGVTWVGVGYLLHSGFFFFFNWITVNYKVAVIQDWVLSSAYKVPTPLPSTTSPVFLLACLCVVTGNIFYLLLIMPSGEHLLMRFHKYSEVYKDL